jgi:copper oxidase (laccase) domain-containing protein
MYTIFMGAETGAVLTREEAQAKFEPQIYTEIQELPDTKGVLHFPHLSEQFPDVVHGSTFGRGNMSDLSVAKTEEAKIQARANTEAVFDDLHLAPIENRVRISPGPDAARVAWITQDTLKANPKRGEAELAVQADAIFTEEEDIAIMVKQADCPVCIVIATRVDEQGKGHKVVGLIHAGAKQADANLPVVAIWDLQLEGYDPKNIHIGMVPGIEMDSYPNKEDDLYSKWPNYDNWRSNRRKFVTEADGSRTHFVDIAGHIADQLIIEGGIPDSNIEMYRRDTATHPEFFSNRRGKESGQEGRDLTLVQRKNPQQDQL